MKLSTKTRYGVRMMQSLSEKHGRGPIYLKDIAREQGISEKYLSLIVIPLRAAGLIRSTRGAHGGYVLSREPASITLKEVVDVLEGETCLVRCIKDSSQCPRVPVCPARDVWAILGEKISETLRGITLDQMVQAYREKEGSLVSNRDIQQQDGSRISRRNAGRGLRERQEDR